MDLSDIKKAIESIIFISDQPVSVDKLSLAFPNVERAQLRKCLKELIEEWEAFNRGFLLSEIAGGFQFRTDPRYSEDISNYNKKVKKFRLSRAALEVTAIIAYKQPVTKVEIEAIRGVDSSGVVNVLMERRVIEIKGRKEVIGKPFLYGTTSEFLEVFGLKTLNDLPTLKELDEITQNLEPAITPVPENNESTL
ncbi:MAG: SMC-Scp complex subunit ScpB [Thermodesulfobacteriota bacterium]